MIDNLILSLITINHLTWRIIKRSPGSHSVFPNAPKASGRKSGNPIPVEAQNGKNRWSFKTAMENHHIYPLVI